jgi:hypothetical protein
MPKLESQQKIISFLSEEFVKIKTQRQFNKRLKLKVTEKLIRKLLNDIELILKTSSFENNVNLKIIDLRNEIQNYLLCLK